CCSTQSMAKSEAINSPCAVTCQRSIVRILYIEEDLATADQTRHHLGKRVPAWTMERVATYDDALARLREHSSLFDLVLSAAHLPENSGLALVSYLNEHALPSPLVLLVAPDQESAARAMVSAGAYDYVIRYGAYLERLPSTLAHILHRYWAAIARR